MTVVSETAKNGPYSGNGATVTFTVSFYFLANSDLSVTRRNADGTESLLALGADYSVSGAGNPAGGSITCVAAPAAGTTITITRNMAKVQGLDLPDGGIFSSAALEQKLDYITMEIQQLAERVDRRPGLSISSTAATPRLADPSANAALIYNSDGTKIIAGPTADQIANAQTYAATAAAQVNAALAGVLTDTSSSSNTIGTGSKTFTVTAGKQFFPGQFITIADQASAANYLHGQVTGYSGTALTVNVLDTGGSGAKSAWNISVSAPQGATGAAGTPGSVWYEGSGAPSSGTGVNGDSYLNTANGDVYTKSGGAWGSPVGNIRGPAGAGAGDMLSANNLSDLASVSTARTNLGLGSLATQNASAVNITGGSVTGLSTPTNTTDAATKAYVDGLAAGLSGRTSCRVATTASLTAAYSNGSSGVGATLTNSGAQAALALDGVAPTANDRVLVKNQSTAAQNGIYTVTNAGSVSTNWVLTRANDFDQAAANEITEGAYTLIEEGSASTGALYIMTQNAAITVGTTAINWTALTVTGAAAGSLTGTTLAGSVISSSLTSVGTLTGGATGAGFTVNFGTSTISGQLTEVHGGTNQTSYTKGDLVYASNTNVLSKLSIGTTGQVLTISGGLPSWGPIATYLQVQDQRASGTNGGSVTGATWTQRSLNTVITNTISGASLSTNQITLPAGTYEISAFCSWGPVAQARLRLRNVTDGVTILQGTQMQGAPSSGAGGNLTPIEGVFTLAAQKVIEIDGWAQSTRATDGLGAALTTGDSEIYADVFIKKVAG